MDVKEAVQLAKGYITELFQDEEISNLGLEEVEFDDSSSSWRVTIGFSRPWDRPTRTGVPFMYETGPRTRSYKLVLIDDNTGEARSVKERETK